MIDNIERWFSRKSAEGVVIALNLLARSEEAGYWLPGASRKVRSLFSKQNVAAKVAKGIETATGAGDRKHPLHLGCREMRYGAFQNARRVLASIPSRLAIDDAHTNALATIREWANDWAPIADAVALARLAPAEARDRARHAVARRGREPRGRRRARPRHGRRPADARRVRDRDRGAAVRLVRTGRREYETADKRFRAYWDRRQGARSVWVVVDVTTGRRLRADTLVDVRATIADMRREAS